MDETRFSVCLNEIQPIKPTNLCKLYFKGILNELLKKPFNSE